MLKQRFNLARVLFIVNAGLVFLVSGIFITNADSHSEVSDLSAPKKEVLSSITTIPTRKPIATKREYVDAKQKALAAAKIPFEVVASFEHLTISHNFDEKLLQTLFAHKLKGTEIVTSVDVSKIRDRAHSVIEELALQYELPADISLDAPVFEKVIIDELTGRLEKQLFHRQTEITELLQEIPTTGGHVAPKYVEVDISQQRLYRWEDGEMVASHVISTGLYGPTPIGTHTILNKYVNAWSPIASAWTPYWMAFSYNSDAEAWLGFHELPYWDGDDGEKIRRPFDTLGKPVTGGCIQLNIGDAKELFDWAEVEIPVIIHE